MGTFIIWLLVMIWFMTVAYYDRKVRIIKRTARRDRRWLMRERNEVVGELFVTQMERDSFASELKQRRGRVFDGLAKERPAEAYELSVAQAGQLIGRRL